MDPTYSWHSGSSVVSSKWGFPVPLFADEGLASFLLRLSYAYGLESIALGEILWPKQRVWTTDTDRMDQSKLAVLSQVTGIEIALLNKTTLGFIESRISSRKPCHRLGIVTPWILPLGCKNRQREGGYSVCPQCLYEDSSPYLRLHWRLAWHTACSKHHCLLVDRCPLCSSSITPHLLSSDIKDIARCSTCHHDLKANMTELCSQDALDLQQFVDVFVSNGTSSFFGVDLDSAGLFSYLSFLESFTRRAMRKNAISIRSVFEDLHIKLPEIRDESKGLKFEKLSVEIRHTLLKGLMQFIRLSPDNLYDCLIHHGITRQSFVGDLKLVPSYILSVVQKLPDNKRTLTNTPRNSGWKPTPKYLVQRKFKQLINSFKKQKNE